MQCVNRGQLPGNDLLSAEVSDIQGDNLASIVVANILADPHDLKDRNSKLPGYYWLPYTQDGSALLNSLVDLNLGSILSLTLALLERINQKTTPVSGQDPIGSISGFWWLTAKYEGRKLLFKLAKKAPKETMDLLQNVDFNVAPVTGEDQNVTVFYNLAEDLEYGTRILVKLASKFRYPMLKLLQSVDLNAARVSGRNGLTAFAHLYFCNADGDGALVLDEIASEYPQEILQLLEKVNFDVRFCSDGVFHWFAEDSDGIDLLIKLADAEPQKTIRLLQTVDLNVIFTDAQHEPVTGENAFIMGENTFIRMLDLTLGLKLLNKLADADPQNTLRLLQTVDLNAANPFAYSTTYGETAFFRLIKEKEGRALIKKIPAILFSPSIVWQEIASSKKYWDALSDTESEPFWSLFMLAGMPELTPWPNPIYAQIKKSMFDLIDPCIRLLWIEKSWPVVSYWHYQTLYQHIVKYHPDLYFLNHDFLEKLVDSRIAELDPNERLRKIAILAVKKYRKNKEKTIR